MKYNLKFVEALKKNTVGLDGVIEALIWPKPEPPQPSSPLTKAYYSNGRVAEYSIIGNLDERSIDKINLTKVEIGNTVTAITQYDEFDSDGAFSDCSNLSSATIPSSVTIIGNYAFKNCSNLMSITIPNRVTSIGYYAFYDCSGLTSITIPDSVTSIGNWAFAGCSGLTSITIPDSVTSIGDWAFDSCSRLTSVTFENKTKTQVQGMSNYSWRLKSGCVIHCTDEDITI